MKPTNHELIRKGLDFLREGLRPFVEKEMRDVYGDSWEEEARDALGTPPYARLNWDAQALLKVMDRKWSDVFRTKLEKRKHRSWVIEARELRDDFAHQKPFPDEDTSRGLDTIECLLAAVSAPESREVALLKSAIGEAPSAPQAHAEVRADFSRISEEQLRTEIDTNFKSGEVEKVRRRLKLWAKHQGQINSRILNAFLKLDNSGASVVRERDLRNELPDIATFENNFNQMKNPGKNNHGKVFEQDGDIVTLWGPVAPFVREYERARVHE